MSPEREERRLLRELADMLDPEIHEGWKIEMDVPALIAKARAYLARPDRVAAAVADLRRILASVPWTDGGGEEVGKVRRVRWNWSVPAATRWSAPTADAMLMDTANTVKPSGRLGSELQVCVVRPLGRLLLGSEDADALFLSAAVLPVHPGGWEVSERVYRCTRLECSVSACVSIGRDHPGRAFGWHVAQEAERAEESDDWFWTRADARFEARRLEAYGTLRTRSRASAGLPSQRCIRGWDAMMTPEVTTGE